MVDSYFFWNQLSDASQSDAPYYAAEYAQAKKTLSRLVESLGGTVCHFQINSVPEIVSAKSMDLPDADRRTLLRQAIAYLCISNAKPEDMTCENLDGEECIAYATYAVLTDLKPCWVSMTAHTLVPGWYCVTEERVVNDDSVSARWSQYGDAQMLMSLEQ